MDLQGKINMGFFGDFIFFSYHAYFPVVEKNGPFKSKVDKESGKGTMLVNAYVELMQVELDSRRDPKIHYLSL